MPGTKCDKTAEAWAGIIAFDGSSDVIAGETFIYSFEEMLNREQTFILLSMGTTHDHVSL